MWEWPVFQYMVSQLFSNKILSFEYSPVDFTSTINFEFLYLVIKKAYYGIKDIAAANMTIGGLIFLLLAYLGTKLLIN